MMNDIIEINCRDIKDFVEPEKRALMVVNPPYGERLVSDNLLQTYKDLGARLKHAFQGNEAWVISSSYDCFDQIGLKASARIALFNGDLDCEFRKFELFQGKFKGFREEGNTLKKDFAPLKRKSRLTGLDGEPRPPRSERREDEFAGLESDEAKRRRRELESYFNTRAVQKIKKRREGGNEKPSTEDGGNKRRKETSSRGYARKAVPSGRGGGKNNRGAAPRRRGNNEKR